MESHPRLALSLLALLTPAAAQTAVPEVPVRFEENRGQADPGWDFVARTPLYTLGVARTRCALRSGGRPAFLELVGAAGTATGAGAAEPEEPRATRVSRVTGRDPARWSWLAPTFARVRYAEVWPGIDVVWRGAGERLEYDFELAPGARVSEVRLRFGPEACVAVAEDGTLVVELAAGPDAGELRQPAPRTWAVTPAGPLALASRFVALAPDEVGFAVDGWDGEHALVIDPALDFLTLFGARGEELVGDVDVDEQGLVHVCGSTRSEDFPELFPADVGPTPEDARNAFLFVFDRTGTELLHALTLGGSELDRAFDVDATHSGQVFLCGETFSGDFPVAGVGGRAPFQAELAGESDAWVARIDLAAGALAYGTYLGGESFDEARAIAVDDLDRACVTGTTRSDLFPLEAAAQPGRAGFEDAFLARIAPRGDELDFSTYEGGSFRDAGRDVALDDSGGIVICGTSDASEVQIHDAFVQAYRADGTLGPRGLVTAGASVEAEALAISSLGDIWVCGNTRADDLPLIRAIDGELDGPQDAWIARFDESLSGEVLLLELSTYWGGESFDRAEGIALDGEFLPDVYVVGTTESRDMLTAAPLSADLGGPSDAFVLRLASSNDPLGVRFASYFPAGDAEDGRGIALDALERPVIAGELSGTGPRPDAIASASFGEVDELGNRSAFVARIQRPERPGPGVVSFGILADTTAEGNYHFHVFRSGGNELATEVEFELLAGEATIATGSVEFAPGETMAEGLVFLRARDEEAPQYLLVLSEASAGHALVEPSQLYLTVTPPLGPGDGSGPRGGDSDRTLPCVGENVVTGTSFVDDLDVLRGVRDRWLARSPFGRSLVRAYYDVLSPLGNRVLELVPWIKGPAALTLHGLVLCLRHPLSAGLLVLLGARLLAERQRLSAATRAVLRRARAWVTRASSPLPSASSPSVRAQASRSSSASAKRPSFASTRAWLSRAVPT